MSEENKGLSSRDMGDLEGEMAALLDRVTVLARELRGRGPLGDSSHRRAAALAAEEGTDSYLNARLFSEIALNFALEAGVRSNGGGQK